MKKISWKKISYPQSKNFEKILKFISKYDRQKNKIQIIISLSNVIVHTYWTKRYEGSIRTMKIP